MNDIWPIPENLQGYPAVQRRVELSNREREVLRLIVEGMSSKEVADSLFCSKRTVDSHLNRIYEKLDVNNRVQAIRRAAAMGMLDTIN